MAASAENSNKVLLTEASVASEASVPLFKARRDLFYLFI